MLHIQPTELPKEWDDQPTCVVASGEVAPRPGVDHVDQILKLDGLNMLDI